jgi:DNA-binding beta-propeller fold protein YncE
MNRVPTPYFLAARRSTGFRAAAIAALVLLGGCAGPPEQPDIGPLAFPRPPDQPRFYFERTLIGTGSARRLDDKDRLRQILTGSSIREGVAFAKPFDVAVHQGRVFVSDTVHRLVFAMDFPTGTSFEIGNRDDEGDLYKPLGIAVDDTGNLYVCDNTQRKILVYDRDGRWQRSIEGKAVLNRPSGIDVTADGSRLFVVDTGGVESDQHQIAVFDVGSGAHLRTIASRGTGEGGLNLPRDVGVDPDGLLYVTDGGNFRVQVFDQEGRFVRTWGSPGRRLGQFSRPKGIALDPQGNVYVADAAFGNFQIFTAQGALLMFIGERSTTPGPAKYMLPAGIDVDQDGRVYMVDQFFRKIDIFRPAALEPTDGFLGQATTEP